MGCAAMSNLKADFYNVFPGGKVDDCQYQDIELALDLINAPCLDADGNWLKLPERIYAYAKSKGWNPDEL